jgi:hypothetical protein
VLPYPDDGTWRQHNTPGEARVRAWIWRITGRTTVDSKRVS